MTKKWLQHVKETIKKNPGLSLHACVQIAETTFFIKKKEKSEKIIKLWFFF